MSLFGEVSKLQNNMYELIELNNIKAFAKLPENFYLDKIYPVFIGLSGGEQTFETAKYSADTFFSSALFNDYISIVPINTNEHNFKDYNSIEITALTKAISEKFNVTTNNWAIAGISNGGKATYNFVANNPSLYNKVATFPGGLFENEPSVNWSHLNIVLANGKKDGYSWLQESKSSFEKLTNFVKKVEIMVISGQKHILSPDYDMNEIYSKLF